MSAWNLPLGTDTRYWYENWTEDCEHGSPACEQCGGKPDEEGMSEDDDSDN